MTILEVSNSASGDRPDLKVTIFFLDVRKPRDIIDVDQNSG